MHPSYYYRAHACILVFDVTRKQTYQHLTDWYKELREFCETIPCIVVANKIDIDPRVTSKEFKFAKRNNLVSPSTTQAATATLAYCPCLFRLLGSHSSTCLQQTAPTLWR